MTWQQQNHAYWQSRKADYPFHAKQTEHITAGYTRPEQLTTARHGVFLRVPIGDAVLWGFRDEASRDRFLADFGGEAWYEIEGETP